MSGIGNQHKSWDHFKRDNYGEGEFTTADAAKAIGIAEKTLIAWVKRGWIPDPDRNYLRYRVWTQEHIDLGRKILTSPGPYSPE